MLVVCILASALGALVMCLLVLRYGFMPILETNPARADRDLLVTRLGHAAAGVCFATSAILAVVYIARAPVQPAAAMPDPRVIARLAALERERHALGEEVAALRDQVGAARPRAGRAAVAAGAQPGRQGPHRLGQDPARVLNRRRRAHVGDPRLRPPVKMGGPEMAPKSPNVQSAPAQPGRSSKRLDNLTGS